MTEEQLRALPAFHDLPVYDECDDRTDAITAPARRGQECATMQQVEECLADPTLVPLGALRVSSNGRVVVVAYFGRSR